MQKCYPISISSLKLWKNHLPIVTCQAFQPTLKAPCICSLFKIDLFEIISLIYKYCTVCWDQIIIQFLNKTAITAWKHNAHAVGDFPLANFPRHVQVWYKLKPAILHGTYSMHSAVSLQYIDSFSNFSQILPQFTNIKQTDLLQHNIYLVWHI